jgi:hypothetical protein
MRIRIIIAIIVLIGIPIITIMMNSSLNELTENFDSSQVCPIGLRTRHINTGETVCFKGEFPIPTHGPRNTEFACIASTTTSRFPYMGLPSCDNYENEMRAQFKNTRCPSVAD